MDQKVVTDFLLGQTHLSQTFIERKQEKVLKHWINGTKKIEMLMKKLKQNLEEMLLIYLKKKFHLQIELKN